MNWECRLGRLPVAFWSLELRRTATEPFRFSPFLRPTVGPYTLGKGEGEADERSPVLPLAAKSAGRLRGVSGPLTHPLAAMSAATH
jgi:hypothetical protein